jgi:aspartate carbamoyltransferase catalytic subunit
MLKDIISISDLSRKEIEEILLFAKELKEKGSTNTFQGKILASLFFEPSTRTRLSFESAMHKIGGSVIGFSESANTSTQKGETLADSIRVISGYSDVIVIRHPMEGAARLAADNSSVPVINAGDGSREHPTQTLLDLFSIQECQGRLDELKIACVGDLKYGRAAHSLALALSLFNIRLYFVSPDTLMPPPNIAHKIKTRGMKYSFHRDIEEVIGKVDILYMLRTQKERFDNLSEYEKHKKAYIVHKKLLEKAKPSMRVLHPLPRLDEISTKVDKTPQAYYFTQAKNGLFVRQAVLHKVLGGINE